ncbi:hypothetical protein H8356DRAFT_1424409 [Neocallimastix lanati (nom. inval.)]|nr:hypothetical protein H8356DRAFT_1424409 [Neocallimastix sp. JGI-2020a]
MERYSIYQTIYSTYIEKQKKFKSLVKSVQYHLESKEYKKEGYSFDEYVKMKWNISKAQAYRYLISAKVLDQLEDFEIQPSYERLCRSLNSLAKTTPQIKLLWKTILEKFGNTPDNISSIFVTKVWKELCNDKKYSNICHYEENIINKVEQTLNKYSKNMKLKQLNTKLVPTKNKSNLNNYNINRVKDNNNYSIKPESSFENNILVNVTENNKNQYIPTVKSNNGPYIYYENNNNNNNYNNIQCTFNQKTNCQNYPEVSYIPTTISTESSYSPLNNNNNVYIIYNTSNGNVQNNSLISPVRSITCNNNNNNNKPIIQNINTQCTIPVTSVTYVNSVSNYLPSPIIEHSSKSLQYIQNVNYIPNIQQNNIIQY